MRSSRKLWKVVSGVALVAVAAAGGLLVSRHHGKVTIERPAHATGDLPPDGTSAIPNVLIFMDTSASQNSILGKQLVPSPFLAGGTVIGQITRFMTFQSVLTGQLRAGTNAAAPTWGPADKGLLDLFADKMRFGFAGVDDTQSTGTGNAGGWSYGPDVPAGPTYCVSYPAATDANKDVAKGVIPCSVSGGAINTGFRNANATSFPLISIYADPDKAVVNAKIQKTVLDTTFGGNSNGFMDAFRDAHYYFSTEWAATATACGDKYLIYMVADVPPGGETTDAIEFVDKLAAEGVQVYVVAQVDAGAALSTQTAIRQYANMIAEESKRVSGAKCAYDPDVYGAGPNCAFIALGGACNKRNPVQPNTCDVSGAGDLAEKLGSVMAIILNQSTSRTRVALADAPLVSTSAYQWRIAGSFQVQNAGGAWRGFLTATKYDAGGAESDKIEFHEVLNARAATDRTIYTLTPGSRGGWTLTSLASALAGAYAPKVTAALTDFAATNPCIAHAFFDSPAEWYRMLSGGTADNLASTACTANEADLALVNFFQGHKLGDIYHSSPIAVGPPDAWISDADYLAYQADQADRATMVYVAANDGMIHAFVLQNDLDPSTAGREAWAFMPPSVFGPATIEVVNADTGETTTKVPVPPLAKRPVNHQLLADATLFARDVQTTRTDSGGGEWATVLLGCLGRGGGACFAFDVTDPWNPGFLWYFQDPALTYVNGQAGLGRVVIKNTSGGFEEHAIALIPGGYNPSDTSKGHVFFVLDLFTGEVLRKFPDSTLDASTAATPDAPFSGPPTSYLDDPGTYTTRFYVGDFKGRLWRGDVSDTDRSKWTFERLFPTAADTTFNAAAYQKPIYLAPSVALDYGRQPVIYYGTGNIADLDTVEPNYIYAVRETTTVVGETTTVTGDLLDEPEYTPGFPIPLASNEKLTGEPVVFNGVLLFTTFVATSGVCGFGEGRLYAVDFLTGKERITSAGKLTAAGASDAVAYMSLGAGVPSSPVLTRPPSSTSLNAAGMATGTGGGFTALIQKGASSRTEDATANILSIDLGTVGSPPRIISVTEVE